MSQSDERKILLWYQIVCLCQLDERVVLHTCISSFKDVATTLKKRSFRSCRSLEILWLNAAFIRIGVLMKMVITLLLLIFFFFKQIIFFPTSTVQLHSHVCSLHQVRRNANDPTQAHGAGFRQPLPPTHGQQGGGVRSLLPKHILHYWQFWWGELTWLCRFFFLTISTRLPTVPI